MNTRSIPKTHDELITHAGIAVAAAEELSDELELLQNTPARIRADLERVKGDPEGEPGRGAQSVLGEARAGDHRLRAERRQAMADGRKFCAAAIDLLKISFGRRWNERWLVVGLSGRSLAMSHDPLPLLITFREFFKLHADYEYRPLGISAARADELATALMQASDAVLAGWNTRSTARKDRDEAIRKLASRLRGLRNELDQLLTRDDPRWRRFGFARPIDQRQPARVAEVAAESRGPGRLHLSWPAATRALDYRVSWALEGSAEPPVEVGLCRETHADLADLPRGATLLVSVSARNRAGESLPTQVRATVP